MHKEVATTDPRPIARARLARWSVGLGIALYGASMLLPATTFTIFETSVVPGFLMVLVAPASLGSLTILGGAGQDDVLYAVAWLANPLLVAGLVLYRRARALRAAQVMAAALAAVGSAFVVLYVLPEPSGFIMPLESGAYVWVAGLAAVFAGAAVAAMGGATGIADGSPSRR